MTQTSNELSATHNAKKKKCLSFARERKRVLIGRAARYPSRARRDPARRLFPLARARSRRAKNDRAYPRLSIFPARVFRRFDSKCRFFSSLLPSQPTGVPLPFDEVNFAKTTSRSSRFRVHATSRAISRARAPTQKCGFLSKRCAPLVCAPSLRVSSLVAFFFR